MEPSSLTSSKPIKNEIGVVSNLWRYPVKSMLGEACDQLTIDTRGVVGDRLFAIRNCDGKFGSGKSTRRFRQIDGLFKFRCWYAGDQLKIRLPNGCTIDGADDGIHALLSKVLGQDVTLVQENDVSHIDDGALHLLTSSSLATLREALPESDGDPRRFRPNILIETPGNGQIERAWLGTTFLIGDSVRIRISKTAERCGMVAFAQADLKFDANVLRWIAEASAMKFGVYAEVIQTGVIRQGDRVSTIA